MTQLQTARRVMSGRGGDVQTVESSTPPRQRQGSGVQVALCLVVYLALSVLANWPAWVHGISHSIQTSGGADVQEEIWFLAQTPWALVHGINPFVNSLVNTPIGINLMDNTSMSVLGLIGAPITFIFGPLATFNVLLDLGFALSAATCFLLVRRFVTWQPAAFIAGLLYGFSPFAIATGNGHLFLLFNVVPPLVLLVIDRTFRSKSTPAWRGGVYLGLCLVAQFFISTEVFASVVVMICLGSVVVGGYAIWARWRLDGRRLARFVAGAAMVSVLGVGYGTWVAIEGPHHIVGPAQTPTALAGLSSDPAALVVPTINQRFTFGEAGTGDQLVAVRNQNWQIATEDAAENGGYIGPPLLALLAMGGIALWRRRRTALLCIVMAFAAIVLSMGSRLHVDGHRTHIPLPFIVLAHLPLLKSSVAARYSLFFWLFAAVLLGLTLDAFHEWVGRRVRRKSMAPWLACWSVAGVALLPLTPSWPYAVGRWSTPIWFTSSARNLPVGTGLLVYPMSGPGDASAMVWQADAHLTFVMPGGYAVFASSSGAASFSGPASMTQEALALCSGGQTLPVPVSVVRNQLSAWKVEKVVVPIAAPGASCARTLFDKALGNPEERQQVMIWSFETRGPAAHSGVAAP